MEINPAPAPSPHVIESSDQDFEAKVIHRSQQIPVLVDFWAPWCGPCRTLGPVLEKLATEGAGRFELVKVNVDESQMVAQVLRIQSIPAVKLFINGAIRDEFMGAYPEPEVVQFLERNLPSVGVGEAVSGLDLWQAGDTLGASKAFSEVLREDPKNTVALIGMGHCLADQGDVPGAKERVAAVNEAELDRLPDRQQMEKLLAALKGRIFLLENAAPDGKDASESALRFSQACQEALAGNFEPALETFLGIVKSDRKFRNDAGRRGMLAVFDLLPPQDPLTSAYRQQLSSILFS